jgi:hypothetical protein
MPRNVPSLSNILAATAKRMLADFDASREIEHRASKGSVREGTVIESLRPFLPGNVSIVGSGEMVSLDGEVSPQCDVLIVDPNSPFLIEEEGYRVALAEAVWGVIEVKSDLTTNELGDAYEKIARVKRMKRSAYGLRRTIQLSKYGREWEYFPPVGMIFAFDGAELETLGEKMALLAAKYEDTPELQVDSVWVLNRGSLTWADPNTHRVEPAPKANSSVQAISARPGEVLLQMIAHLHEHLQIAFTPGVRLLPYIKDASFGEHLMSWGRTPRTDEANDR